MSVRSSAADDDDDDDEEDVDVAMRCDTDTMTSLDHDDVIEIISSHGDSATPITDTAYTTFTSADATSLDIVLPSGGQTDALSDDGLKALATGRCEMKTPPPSKKQKRIKRAVMAVGTLLITMSLILVGVTLYLSEHIDEMVRKMNNGLYTSTAPLPTVKSNVTDDG